MSPHHADIPTGTLIRYFNRARTCELGVVYARRTDADGAAVSYEVIGEDGRMKFVPRTMIVRVLPDPDTWTTDHAVTEATP